MGFHFGRKTRHAKPRAAVSAVPAAESATPAGSRGSDSDEEVAESHWSAAPGRETGIPRWRRQSLIAARKATPGRAATVAPMLFASDAAREVQGLERRRVRYRLVRLLDIPDDALGVEVDVLDDGDEVAVLEQRGMYCRVLCPDWSEGWVHRMTLGPVLQAPPPPPYVPEIPGLPQAHGELDPGTFEDVIREARGERPGDAG